MDAGVTPVFCMKHYLLPLAGILLALAVRGQDLHYSQFYHNPMHLNPAQTGVFIGTWRAAGLYRDQWRSVPVGYRTFAGAFDWKAFRRRSNLFATGLLVQQDKAGDAGLSWTQIGLSASAVHTLGAQQAISVGFGAGFAQRTVDLSKLTFKNQWAGGEFNPALPSKETGLASSTGFSPTLSAGLNWHLEGSESRLRVDAGVGASHLNRPKINLDDAETERLPMRLAGSVHGYFPINIVSDIVVFGEAQQMRTARELVAGAGFRRWLTPETAVQFSLASRFGDAIIPALQVERGGWTVGLSYDWNTSDFNEATNGRGGFEMAVVYRAVPVPPVKTLKACPIF